MIVTECRVSGHLGQGAIAENGIIKTFMDMALKTGSTKTKAASAMSVLVKWTIGDNWPQRCEGLDRADICGQVTMATGLTRKSKHAYICNANPRWAQRATGASKSIKKCIYKFGYKRCPLMSSYKSCLCHLPNQLWREANPYQLRCRHSSSEIRRLHTYFLQMALPQREVPGVRKLIQHLSFRQ